MRDRTEFDQIDLVDPAVARDVQVEVLPVGDVGWGVQNLWAFGAFTAAIFFEQVRWREDFGVAVFDLFGIAGFFVTVAVVITVVPTCGEDRGIRQQQANRVVRARDLLRRQDRPLAGVRVPDLGGFGHST